MFITRCYEKKLGGVFILSPRDVGLQYADAESNYQVEHEPTAVHRHLLYWWCGGEGNYPCRDALSADGTAPAKQPGASSRACCSTTTTHDIKLHNPYGPDSFQRHLLLLRNSNFLQTDHIVELRNQEPGSGPRLFAQVTNSTLVEKVINTRIGLEPCISEIQWWREYKPRGSTGPTNDFMQFIEVACVIEWGPLEEMLVRHKYANPHLTHRHITKYCSHS